MNKRSNKLAGIVILVVVLVSVALFIAIGMFFYTFYPDGRFAALIGDDAYAFFLAVFLFGTPVLLAAVAVPYRLISKARHNALLNQTPEVRVPAKVVLKTVSTHSQSSMSEHSGLKIVQIYSVTFELPESRRIAFPVTLEQYNLILEGDAGTLTYKQRGEGAYFVAFQPQSA